MKKLKLSKLLVSFLIAGSVLGLNPIAASAEWKQDSAGWWYAIGNEYAKGWKEIQGRWYYFYDSGYMAKSKTIDGYLLGSNGAWIEGIDTKPKNISVQYPSNWVKINKDGVDEYYLDNKGTIMNFASENMQGVSEEEYIKYCKSYLQNVDVQEQVFNNKKATVFHYYMNENNKKFFVYYYILCNNNTAYIFSLGGLDPVSDENMISFKNMLNTVQFTN